MPRREYAVYYTDSRDKDALYGIYGTYKRALSAIDFLLKNDDANNPIVKATLDIIIKRAN